MVWCSSGDLSKFCRNLIACQHGWLLLEGISTWQGSCLRAADLHHSQAAWNDMKTGAVRCQDPARSFAGVTCAYPRSPGAAKVWEESIWPRIILSTALVLNPTWCYHTHIPGLGWDWALTSWIEQKWRLEGEMKLCGSRNRGKSWGPRLEEAWRAGIQAGRLRPEQDTKAGDRRGENGKQWSQAQAVVALWWSPTCWLPHSLLWRLLPGRTWVMWPHRMAQGLEATSVSCERTTQVAKASGSRTGAILCREAGWGKGWVLNHPCDDVQVPTWRHGRRLLHAVMSALWQHTENCSHLPRQSSAEPCQPPWDGDKN